jgi:hypothetical protein
LDFLWFFLSGSIGGLILIWSLNRQGSTRGWWAVLVAFVLASPVALLMMIGGGMLGPLGVLVFAQVPWLIGAGVGALIGWLIRPK